MNSLLIASALIVIVVMMGSLFACWFKTSASQKIKDRLMIALYLTFASGTFFCFSLHAALLLALVVGACVAADFFIRKGSSDADQQH